MQHTQLIGGPLDGDNIEITPEMDAIIRSGDLDGLAIFMPDGTPAKYLFCEWQGYLALVSEHVRTEDEE